MAGVEPAASRSRVGCTANRAALPQIKMDSNHRQRFWRPPRALRLTLASTMGSDPCRLSSGRVKRQLVTDESCQLSPNAKRPATEVTGLLTEVGVRSTSQQYLCQGSHRTATMSIAFANLASMPLPSVG